MKHIKAHLDHMLSGGLTQAHHATDALLDELRATSRDKRALEALGRGLLATITSDLKKAAYTPRKPYCWQEGLTVTDPKLYMTQYLTITDACTALRMSRWTLDRIRKSDKDFPRFFAISPGRKVISKPAFEHWLRSKEVAQVAGK